MKPLILLAVLPFLVACEGIKFKVLPSITKTESGYEITTTVEVSSKSPKKVTP